MNAQPSKPIESHGGQIIAQVLHKHGVRHLFTLVGGHISPILVAAKQAGIRVVDVRHEVTAAFAADAVGRLTNTVGVAAVTAGPGLTNTLTAVKNAQQAQSPMLVLGGATATVLKGRGSLQDIDQMSLVAPHVKWYGSLRRLHDVEAVIQHALNVARSGVPGPVFVECPLDLLYPEALVRSWYQKEAQAESDLGSRLIRWYLKRHLDRQFGDPTQEIVSRPLASPAPAPWLVRRVAGWLRTAKRPVLVLGSQVVSVSDDVCGLAQAVERLGLPVFLAGMARGLLGASHPQHIRTGRKRALAEADVVLVAGLPFDFRLGYGMQVNRKAKVVSVNASLFELHQNREPTLAIHSHPGLFLRRLESALTYPDDHHLAWVQALKRSDGLKQATCLEHCDNVDPIFLCQQIDQCLDFDSILVADGGDFVATASYVVRPRKPLSWLDPGVFGTLGVGAGFALGAKLSRPQAETWILYGDGSLGYSLIEFDTFSRHRLGVIAVVGNDGSWAQIERDQVAVFEDDVACRLQRSDYHLVAQALGGVGLLVENNAQVTDALVEAKALAASGRPVLINAHITSTDFRHGSLSL